MNRFKAIWARILKQNLSPLMQVWAGRYPVARPRKHSLIEKILMTPVLVARSLSLTNLGAFFSPGGAKIPVFVDFYVLAWVVLLSAFLFAGRPAPWLVVALAAYRVVEIVTYHFAILLVDSQVETYRLISVRRSFVFAIMNLYEIVAAYALIYLVAGNIVQITTGTSLSSGTSALYYSVVTMATLGYGEFYPADDPSRAIVMVQLMTGVLFFVGIVPILAANLAPSLTGQSGSGFPARRP